MTKILLVHPLGYSSDIAGYDISRKANIMPPLGLASIAAYLEQNDITTAIVDCYAKPFSEQLIKDYVSHEKPSLVGFSCTTSSFLDGVRLAHIVKETEPKTGIVFGGHHVSALKQKVIHDFPVIDFCVVGEGEETIHQLVDRAGESPQDIEGLVFKDNSGEIIFTGYRSPGLELDALPFPAYEKLDGFPHVYTLPIFNYPHIPNSSCIASRGCPYACSYCDRSVFLRTFRYNSAEYLYEHLKYLRNRFGIRHINFYDDQFTFHRKRVEEFARLMMYNPLGMTYNCAVRAEHIDYDLMVLMKDAGCWMISLGIETGDEALLAQHRKNPDLEMLAEKIRLIKKAGIRVKGLMMMGLPGETTASIRKSMDYVFSLPIDDINVSKFTPFPGTPLYDQVADLGTFDEDWPRMDCMHFLFIPKGMTKEELEKHFQTFYKNHFKRFKILIGYVTMIWKSPDSWKRFLSNLFHFIRFALSNKRISTKNNKS